MRLDDDDFTLFGLPARQALDEAALDVRRRALQAEAHPDRHAAGGPAAQRVAMQWSVRINEAYRRLRDPLTRAAYLCELRGAPIEAETHTAMPAAFLMQQLAWRESLDEARDAAAIDALGIEVRAARRSLLDDVRSRLDERDDVQGAAADVRALMFVERFLRDLDDRQERLGQ